MTLENGNDWTVWDAYFTGLGFGAVALAASHAYAMYLGDTGGWKDYRYAEGYLTAAQRLQIRNYVWNGRGTKWGDGGTQIP